jgi:hypothetical protein
MALRIPRIPARALEEVTRAQSITLWYASFL